MNTLILTVSAGYGHISVSNVLKQYLEKNNESVKIFDILQDVNPIINTVFTEYYLKAIKYIPDVYSYLYKKEAEKALSNPRQFKRSTKKLKQKIKEEELTVTDIFNRVIIKKKLMSLLENEKPDFIICTHPFIGEILELGEIENYVKSRDGLNASIITIVTDYVVHPSWLNAVSDFFIFPSDKLKHLVNNLNQELEKKVRYYGIPISEDFNKKMDKLALRKKYKIKEDAFTYLLMGGGYGIGKIKDEVKLILNKEHDANIIVICGNNHELYESISEIKTDNTKGNNLTIFGFTDKVYEIMKLSDVIVTKPGGISITEAMACRLPIVIREYLGGQEEQNTEFILNNHLGIYTKEDINFLAYIQQLNDDESYRNQIKDNQCSVYNSNTLEQIYSLMKEEQNKKEII